MQNEFLNSAKSDRYGQFLSLYSVNQKRIFSYILSLVPRRVDAEDILQQTTMEMWRLFDRFEAGTEFAAWGIAISRFQVFKFRKKQHKEKSVFFLNDEAFQIILTESSTLQNNPDYRLPALEGCIKRLKDREKKLLILRYENGQTYQSIAETMDYSLALIYKTMTTIHTTLQRCIRRTLSMWDAQ